MVDSHVLRLSLLAVGVLAVGMLTVEAAVSPPAAVAATAGHDWLVSADTAARTVTVTDTSTGRRTGGLTDVQLGTHAGVVQLGGGRIAFMDESRPRLDVVAITASGRPELTASYPIPTTGVAWERAGWLSTDPSHRFVAVGSDFDGSTTQQATVVDLRKDRAATAHLTTSEVTLATTGATGTEEMETFLTGSPLRLTVTAGGHLDSYSVADILGGDGTPKRIATTPFGAYPHGPIVDRHGTVIGSTLHDGIETVPVAKTGFGRATSEAYPEPAGQSYRPRMAPDGHTAVGTRTASAPGDPAVLTSSSTGRTRVASVGLEPGTPTRAVVAPGFAAAVVTAAGVDTLDLVTRDSHGLYAGKVTRLVLPALGQAPGTAPAPRFLAATDDGSELFLSRAGTGSILEIDVRDGIPSVRGTIAADGPLADGGYLATVDSAQRPYDLIGR